MLSNLSPCGVPAEEGFLCSAIQGFPQHPPPPKLSADMFKRRWEGEWGWEGVHWIHNGEGRPRGCRFDRLHFLAIVTPVILCPLHP